MDIITERLGALHPPTNKKLFMKLYGEEEMEQQRRKKKTSAKSKRKK